MMISMVIKPLQSAALTAFAQVHHKSGQVGPAYLRVTRTCALVSCPVFFGAAAIAPDFVTFIFGPKWTEGSYIMIALRSEEHTSELQSLMRISYAVFCLKKKKKKQTQN